MKHIILLTLLLFYVSIGVSQNVQVDGRLQPLLTQFFEYCDHYSINYQDKLFKLENIDIVNTLPTNEHRSVLGMVRRNDKGSIVGIDINWMAQIDPEVLKVVAFHEFAHYFLEYPDHICNNCEHIMAVVNTSYFDIAKDWDNQVKSLFIDSPAYQKQQLNAISLAGHQIDRP